MIKAKKLRVLLVEPSQDEAALTLGRLRECGYEVDHMQVVNAPAMEAALADARYFRDLAEEGEEVVRRGRPEDLARLERPLERGAAEVREKDVQVVGVKGRQLVL